MTVTEVWPVILALLALAGLIGFLGGVARGEQRARTGLSNIESWLQGMREEQLAYRDEQLERLRGDLKDEQAERRKLLELVMQLREQGQVAGPEHFDERWEGGKYVMGKEETPEKDPEQVALERDVRTAVESEL